MFASEIAEVDAICKDPSERGQTFLSGSSASDAFEYGAPFLRGGSISGTACDIGNAAANGASTQNHVLGALMPHGASSCNFAPNGQPFPFWNIVSAKDGSVSAYEGGALLHSVYNPKREALQAVANSDFAGCRAAVFFGFGLGYAVEACVLRFPDRAIIVVEPNAERFFASLALTDWTAVFSCKDCIAALACPPHTVISFIEKYGASCCAFFSVPSQTAHASHYFDTLRTLVERNRRKDDINDATLKRFAKRWLKNSCKNINNYARMRGVSAYAGNARGIPFTIVAAGPSLESTLPYLQEIKKRSVVVCVDTALRACLRFGVEPDFIVVGDPQYYAYRHIAGLTSRSSVLIAEVAVYPSVFSFPCRDFALSSSFFPVGKWFERRLGEKGDLGAGGSVASAAWNFAYAAGASEICCCGLDFAFPEKKTHIRGSLFEEGTHENSMRTLPAETQNLPLLFSAGAEEACDYDGKSVPTDSRMKMFAWWFESRLASCPDVKTYTFTRSGIAIPGIEPTDMSAFLEKPDITARKREFIKKSEASKKGAAPEKERFESVLAEFLSEIALFRKTAENGKRICENALESDTHTATTFSSAAGYGALHTDEMKTRADDMNSGVNIASAACSLGSDARNFSDGDEKRSAILRALALIDDAISKSSVKDAVSLALPDGKCFAELGESGNKTGGAFRESILRSLFIYSELLRAAFECEKNCRTLHAR